MTTVLIHSADELDDEIFIGQAPGNTWRNLFDNQWNPPDVAYRAYVNWLMEGRSTAKEMRRFADRVLRCDCRAERCHGHALVAIANGVAFDCLDLFVP